MKERNWEPYRCSDGDGWQWKTEAAGDRSLTITVVGDSYSARATMGANAVAILRGSPLRKRDHTPRDLNLIADALVVELEGVCRQILATVQTLGGADDEQ